MGNYSRLRNKLEMLEYRAVRRLVRISDRFIKHERWKLGQKERMKELVKRMRKERQRLRKQKERLRKRVFNKITREVLREI